MPQEFLCPKCHQPVKPTAKFCGNCGQVLQPIANSQDPAPTQSTAPAASAPTAPAASAPAPAAAPVQAPTSTGTMPTPPSAYLADMNPTQIPGAKPAAWFAIILGSIYMIVSLLALLFSSSALPADVVPNSTEATVYIIALLINALLALALISCGVAVLRAKQRPFAKKILFALLGLQAMIAISSLLSNILAAILPAIGAILAYRASRKA